MSPVHASVKNFEEKNVTQECHTGDSYFYQDPNFVLSLGAVASTARTGFWKEISVPFPVPLIKQQGLVLAKHFVRQSHRAFSLSCGRQ